MFRFHYSSRTINIDPMKNPLFFQILVLFCFPILVQSKTLNIVTSIPPLNALAAGITESISEPTMIIPTGVSHHHYTFKPSTMRTLQNADVLIWIGPNLETFLQKPIHNLSQTTTVITIEKIPTLQKYGIRNNADWMSEPSLESGIDPHLWLDPQNAIVIIKNVTETFRKLDPENSSTYQKNAAKMIQQINILDQELLKALALLQSKPFLVYHDGYQYFEKHYHLDAVGSIISDSDLPPSAKRIKQLQEKIKKENIQCLFTEPDMHSTMINTLVRDTRIHIAPLDTLGKGQHFTDYLNLLRTNANEMKQCLTASPLR